MKHVTQMNTPTYCEILFTGKANDKKKYVNNKLG
jgi:hypothetical protein